jgi:hypothetical protein
VLLVFVGIDTDAAAAVAGAVAGTGVPAGTSSVVYDVTLKSFVKAKEKWEMNNQEKVNMTSLQRLNASIQC